MYEKRVAAWLTPSAKMLAVDDIAARECTRDVLRFSEASKSINKVLVPSVLLKLKVRCNKDQQGWSLNERLSGCSLIRQAGRRAAEGAGHRVGA